MPLCDAATVKELLALHLTLQLEPKRSERCAALLLV